jgi:hypothetical protein
VTSTDALARMLLQTKANASEVLMQHVLDRLAQQTFVGGKQIARQKLSRLPEEAATIVHRVKVSPYGAKPPLWRRLEIPSFMPDGGPAQVGVRGLSGQAAGRSVIEIWIVPDGP